MKASSSRRRSGRCFATCPSVSAARSASRRRLVSYSGHETLAAGAVEPVPRAGLVESLRAVKDENELAAIKRACEITDRMFDRLAGEKFIGRTERDIAWRIQELFHEEGGEGLAFESVVASGPNAARPHSRAGERKIQAGETVIVDTGCAVSGYVSDYTRTFATGPLDGELKEAYATVPPRAAGRRSRRSVRASRASTRTRLARRVVDESPFAGTFGHGLGHGLGLEVHEAPRLSTESTDTLVAGQRGDR